MKQVEEHIVDLDLPVNKRWGFLINYQSEINDLLQYYLSDLENADVRLDEICLQVKDKITTEYNEEIEFISSITNFSANEVLRANLYYDMLKFYLGCTAFGVEYNGRVLHSRNLDWWTENNILSSYSKIFDFRKSGKTVFKTVGWVGFIGVLSGTKPGKFSLTLNAVLSNDKPQIELPITFLIRDILSTADSFEEAKEKLERTKIASDCLLLLTGTKEGEMVVIERTPTRYATRTTDKKYIVVTNDYKKLENNSSEEGLLQLTSCGRFDRTENLLETMLPVNIEMCFNILQDENVMMGITVQQMVFDNQTGKVTLIKRSPSR